MYAMYFSISLTKHCVFSPTSKKKYSFYYTLCNVQYDTGVAARDQVIAVVWISHRSRHKERAPQHAVYETLHTLAKRPNKRILLTRFCC